MMKCMRIELYVQLLLWCIARTVQLTTGTELETMETIKNSLKKLFKLDNLSCPEDKTPNAPSLVDLFSPDQLGNATPYSEGNGETNTGGGARQTTADLAPAADQGCSPYNFPLYLNA
ncbi:hypothetical protein O6P43_012224 [Quillaja saponaria]|uniref:Uncharacterized protein n=1 Tax=Quillaja saponaria TaxID=32244 RepID=A0AAD7M3L2_QUISA|nr:hypothetical protein O6P43_012224 [Quillaja saponaria]